MPLAHDDDLRLAHLLADQADEITLERFGAADLRVESKGDSTEVSEADTAAELHIRSQLRRLRPGDAVFGEEGGRAGQSERTWVIDPIDGTANYVRGVPVWASLIALMTDKDVTVGLVSAPALGRRWWAGIGLGSWSGSSLSRANRLAVSDTPRLADASLAISSTLSWEASGRLDSMINLQRTVRRTRGYGDFWPYMMVAEGSVDLACEPELALWDMAALVPIVTEAGGRFTSLHGVPGPGGGNAAASNGLLHDALLAALRPGSVPA